MYSSGRPDVGTTSRLSRIGKAQHFWDLPCGELFPFPVVLDIQHVDPQTNQLEWRFEAYLDLVAGKPSMTSLHAFNPSGLDTSYLQTFFRWHSPLDVIEKMVPSLVAAGQDPFEFDYPANGYPDAAQMGRHPLSRLSDAFLSDVAAQYRQIGRGYTEILADHYGVSHRTVVSWVEKARKRGILGKTTPGKIGELPKDQA